MRILNLADVDNYPKVRKLFETARIRIRPAEDKLPQVSRDWKLLIEVQKKGELQENLNLIQLQFLVKVNNSKAANIFKKKRSRGLM